MNVKYIAVAFVCAATPAAAQTAEWDGFYAGVHGGGGVADRDASYALSNGGTATESVEMHGLLGGVTAGVNRQFGSLVVGVEGDVSGSAIDARQGMGVADFASQSLQWLATVRGRAGYAHDAHLFYVTAGAAAASYEHVFEAFGLRAEDEEVLWGVTAGAGYERALGEGWSLKAEYMYTNFGMRAVSGYDQIVSGTGSRAIGFDFDVDVDLQIGRIGLNRRF